MAAGDCQLGLTRNAGRRSGGIVLSDFGVEARQPVIDDASAVHGKADGELTDLRVGAARDGVAGNLKWIKFHENIFAHRHKHSPRSRRAMRWSALICSARGTS